MDLFFQCCLKYCNKFVGFVFFVAGFILSEMKMYDLTAIKAGRLVRVTYVKVGRNWKSIIGSVKKKTSLVHERFATNLAKDIG